MNNVIELVASLPQLSYTDRQALRKQVEDDLIKKPSKDDPKYKPDDLLDHKSTYTWSTKFLYGIMLLLTTILIVVTAGISALRIHAAGSEICEKAHPDFKDEVVPFTDWPVCDFTGWGYVSVSEAALFVFPLIAAVIGEKSKRDSVWWITTVSMGFSIMLALTLNFYLERPDRHSKDLASGLANYLTWLAAPGIALGLTLCIKQFVIRNVEDQKARQKKIDDNRNLKNKLYEEDLELYSELILEPEKHPKFRARYSQKIYDHLRRSYYPSMGYDETTLQLLKRDHWKTIVQRELEEDNIAFTGGSLTQQRLEDQNIQVRLKEDGLYYGYIVDLAYETPKGYASETRARNTALKYARQYGAS